MNEHIQHTGFVRLIDEKYNLIGVMEIEQAKQQAQNLEKDIVLMNEAVEPAICRVCDYSDELAKRFFLEIQQSFKKQKPERNLEIGHSITIQDLRVKVETAKIILKKQKRLTIYCVCPITEVYQSKNIFFKFRDMCAEFIMPLGNIKTQEYVDRSEFYGPKDEEKQEQILVEYSFENIGEIEATNPIPQLKIERQINQLYACTKRQKQYRVDDVLDNLKKYEDDANNKNGTPNDEQQIPEEDLTNEPIWQKKPKRKGKGFRVKQQPLDLDEIMKQSKNDWS